MSPEIRDRVLLAEGFAAELEACPSIEEYSPLVRRLLLAGTPGLLMTHVATSSGQIKRLSQLVADTRHRLEPPPVQPLHTTSTSPRHAPLRYPRRVR